MKIKQLIYKLLESFSLRKHQEPPRDVDPLIPAMMQALEMTHDHELSCDEVMEMIDQYAELAQRGEPVEILFPLIKHHLDLCRDCLEEYEALVRLLSAASNPGTI